MKKRKYKTSYPKGVFHYSDCAVHNEPAMPAGECDCGYYKRKAHEFAEMFIGHPLPGAPEQITLNQ